MSIYIDVLIILYLFLEVIRIGEFWECCSSLIFIYLNVDGCIYKWVLKFILNDLFEKVNGFFIIYCYIF